MYLMLFFYSSNENLLHSLKCVIHLMQISIHNFTLVCSLRYLKMSLKKREKILVNIQTQQHWENVAQWEIF